MYFLIDQLIFIGFFLVCAFEGIVNADQDEDLKKHCRYADAMQNEYKAFFKITDLNGVRSEGYIANFTFYVKAQRDAHVLFTTGPRAIRGDNEYEMVIGGWDGTQTVIRRKQQSQQPLASAQHSEIISRQKWVEYLLQIRTQGDIKLHRKEDNGSYRLIVVAYDTNPLPVEYISFGSWENNHVEFFFDCSYSTVTPEIDFYKTHQVDICAFSLLTVLPTNAPQDANLKEQCRYADATENEYKDFFKITDLSGVRLKGYIVRFPFFLKAQRDAHVLLTNGPEAIRESNEYEIVIGGWGGIQTVIRRKQQSQEPLAAAQHSEIISGQEYTAFLLQITAEGNIKLFRNESTGLHRLIIEANDPNPLPVEYISFGSWDNNHVEFYFNCLLSIDIPNTVFEKNSSAMECGPNDQRYVLEGMIESVVYSISEDVPCYIAINNPGNPNSSKFHASHRIAMCDFAHRIKLLNKPVRMVAEINYASHVVILLTEAEGNAPFYS